jgi:hypothetical protein
LSIDHPTTIRIDHFPVPICIKGQRATPQIQAKERWNLKKINWDSFNILSEKEIVTGSENVSELNHYLTEAMSWAERLSPRYKISHSQRGVPWWNDKCPKAKGARQPKLNGRQLIKYDARGIRKTSPPTKKRERRERKPSSKQRQNTGKCTAHR